MIDTSACEAARGLYALAGAVAAVAVAPVALPRALALSRRALASRALAWLHCRPLAPVGEAYRALRRRLDPVGERRRDLGRYLAALPPHSGLTAYEEMEAAIDALPDGMERLHMRATLRGLPRPSRRDIIWARRKKGKPQIPPWVIAPLLRGKAPSARVAGEWLKGVAI